jgi:hypothetical protein
VLVREYRGERYTVTVARDGFAWQGSTYTSLSAIAHAITGTAWSGPRFFALRMAGDRQQVPSPGAPAQITGGPASSGRHHRGAARSRRNGSRATASIPPHP